MNEVVIALEAATLLNLMIVSTTGHQVCEAGVNCNHRIVCFPTQFYTEHIIICISENTQLNTDTHRTKLLVILSSLDPALDLEKCPEVRSIHSP